MKGNQGQRMSAAARIMSAIGFLASPFMPTPRADSLGVNTQDRRYKLHHRTKGRGTPRRPKRTRAMRKAKHEMQKESRQINRKLNRRHPG